jgi:hypothetical protein
MQQKGGHDLWPLVVLNGLALRRVQPDAFVNNHSGYSRVRVSANYYDVQLHIRKSRADHL